MAVWEDSKSEVEEVGGVRRKRERRRRRRERGGEGRREGMALSLW